MNDNIKKDSIDYPEVHEIQGDEILHGRFGILKQMSINAGYPKVFIKEKGKCFFVMSNGGIVDIPVIVEAKVLNFLLNVK